MSYIFNQNPERRPTLLVVDDEIGPRESLRMVFKDRYDVVLAASGREGVEFAQRNRIDVAVVDIRMPGLSGVEVLHALKQIDPNMEVVMLTAYGTFETEQEAIHLGAADYLTKPFDVDAIRDLLEKYYQRRTLRLDAEENKHSRFGRG